MSDPGAVPALRFPEFSGAWEERRLRDIGELKNGFNADKSAFGSGAFFVNLMDIFGLSELTTEPKGQVTASDREIRDFSLHFGDVLFVRSSVKREGVGQSCVVKRNLDDTIFSGFIIRFRKSVGHLSDDFSSYCFNIGSFRNQILSLATSSANTNINQDSLGSSKVFLPTLPEQQKIADFLGAVDARVGLLRRRRDALTAYKKAMMQRLFARDLRFTKADGSPFPDWQEKRLGEIASIRKGEQLNRDTLSDVCEFPVINGGMTTSGYTDQWNTDANVITLSEGGNSCGYVDWQSKKFWLGGHCYAILPKSSDCNDLYLLQALKRNQAAIMRLRVGSGLPNIQKGDLSKVPLGIPQPEEQQKIATFLTALDTKIDAVATQIAAMQRFKQGLLQQMFV